ncbi:MAG TPA: hypothetical protein PLX83_19600, partial [bacterium]|nr:hypothetical protein [bacterium]
MREPEPKTNAHLSRREMLKLAGGLSLASLFPLSAEAALDAFDIVTLDPLKLYPYRGWEDLYRTQYAWDR